MIGSIISHYKILEKLGEGGMGIVYKAEDTKLDRLVALKFLPSHLSKTDSDKARFLREAKAAAALNHNNVCTIYEIHDEDENPFIVMECVEGKTLKEIINDCQKEPIPLNTVIDYTAQIGEALKTAHSKGIVHRDIKAENIMVTETGVVKVMDFGLAKLSGSAQLTKDASTLGTVAYMSPEQIEGKEVDARADIFSFAVVLYEMLSCRMPFRGEYDSATMYAIINEEPEPIQKHRSDLSSEMLHVLNRALEKNPEERYQSVNDMLIDLKRIVKEQNSDKTEIIVKPKQRSLKKILLPAGIITILVIAYFILNPLVFERESKSKSIVVIPFENMTGDRSFDVWGRNLSKLLSGSLSGSAELFVLDQMAVDDVIAKSGPLQTVEITPTMIEEIVDRNSIGILILGEILPKTDDKLRLLMRIKNVENNKILYSTIVNGESLDDFFPMVDNLADSVRNYLEIKTLKEGTIPEMRRLSTNSAEAYRYFSTGLDLFFNGIFHQHSSYFKKPWRLTVTL